MVDNLLVRNDVTSSGYHLFTFLLFGLLLYTTRQLYNISSDNLNRIVHCVRLCENDVKTRKGVNMVSTKHVYFYFFFFLLSPPLLKQLQ